MNTSDNHNINVATYARVSTQEQALENTSLAAQKNQLDAYCQMMGWAIINSYVDPGYSGKSGDRPGLKQLICDAKIGLFDKVLVCKLDRMARNLRLLMDIEAELRNFEISLISIKECVDTSNSTGKMVFQLFGMIAEWERETIIERVRSGRIQRYKEGCWACGNPPYGYSYDKATRKLVVNEEQAKVIRLIFEEYNSGKSLVTVNKMLDDQRIPTIRGRKRGWIDAGIRFILINPVYKGKLIVNRKCHITNVNKIDTNEIIEIKVPPIVSESVWNLAQSILNSNKKIRPPRKNRWLLQGIISCGSCGLSYQGQFRSSITRCYACRGRLKSAHTDGSPRCAMPIFGADWLENEVWKTIAGILSNPDELDNAIKRSMENIKARQQELASIVKPIDDKLAQIATRKSRMAEDWILNNMEPAKYKKLQNTLRKEEIRLKTIRSNVDPSKLTELENVNGILEYWQHQSEPLIENISEYSGNLKLLTRSKSMIKIEVFEDINLKECSISPILQRQVLDRLHTKIVVFHDRIEISCQIFLDDNKSFDLTLPLKL